MKEEKKEVSKKETVAIAPTSIKEKLKQVASEIPYLKKDGHVNFNKTNFKYVSHESITNALGPILNKYGIIIIPRQSYHDGFLEVIVRFESVDTDEFRESNCLVKIGTTNQDIGAAYSYATKFIYSKMFMIETGDKDPEMHFAEEQEKEERKKKEQEKQKVKEVFLEECIPQERIENLQKLINGDSILIEKLFSLFNVKDFNEFKMKDISSIAKFIKNYQDVKNKKAQK